MGVWGASRSGMPRVAGPLAWIPTEDQRGLVCRPNHVFPPGFCPCLVALGGAVMGGVLTWVRAGSGCQEPRVLAVQTCFQGVGTERLGTERGVGASLVGSSDSWLTKQPQRPSQEEACREW